MGLARKCERGRHQNLTVGFLPSGYVAESTALVNQQLDKQKMFYKSIQYLLLIHTTHMKPIITAYFFFYSNQFIQHHSFSSLLLIKLSRITPAVDSPIDTTLPPSPNQALSNYPRH